MKKPPAFIAVCVLGIVLGALSFCCGTYGAAAPLIQNQMSENQRGQLAGIPGGTGVENSVVRMQEEMSRLMPYTVGSAVLSLLFGLLLLTTSSLSLALQTQALRAFSWVLAAGFLWSMMKAAGDTWITFRTAEMMRQMMQGATGGMAGAGEMDGIMGATMAWGMCWVIGLTGVKLLYFGGAFIYLRSDEATRFLGADGSAAASEPAYSPRGDA